MPRVRPPGTVERVGLSDVPAPVLPRPQGLARGIKQAAGALEALGERVRQEQVSAEVAEAEAEYARTVSELEQEIQQEPDASKAVTVFRTRAEKALGRAVMRISDSTVRRRVEARLRTRLASAEVDVRARALHLANRRAKQGLENLLAVSAERAAAADSPSAAAVEVKTATDAVADLVERGVLTPEEGKATERAFLASVEKKRVIRLVDGGNTDAAKAALKASKNLTTEEKHQLLRLVEAHRAETDVLLRQDVQRAADFLKTNGTLPENMPDIVARAEASGDARLIRTVREISQAGADLERIIRLPPAEQAAELEKLRQRTRTTEGMLRYQLVAGGVAAFLKLVQKDPLMAAQRAGVVAALQPIDLNNPDPEAGKRRVAQAELVARKYGLPAALPFTASEIDQVRKAIEEGDYTQVAAVVDAVTELVGPEHAARILAVAGGKKTPELAVAADQFARGDRETALQVIRGWKLRGEEPAAIRAEIPRQEVRDIIEEQLGDAFSEAPAMLGALERAAVALYTDMATRKGFRRFDPDLFREAVRRIAGPLDINGYPTIPPRADWTEDDFTAAVRALPPKALKGAFVDNGLGQLVPLTKDDLAHAQFLYAGPGYYHLKFGDGIAVTETGEPFVLRLEAQNVGEIQQGTVLHGFPDTSAADLLAE